MKAPVRLPNSVPRTQATVNVFNRGAGGLPDVLEEYVISLADLDPGGLSNSPLGLDDTYRGSVITRFRAGVNLTQWQMVYLLPSGSTLEWQLADADGSGTFPARGIVVADTAALANATVLTYGEVRNDAWGWIAGANVYLSATPGALTQTAPGSGIQAVGWATSADTIMFNITPTFRPS